MKANPKSNLDPGPRARVTHAVVRKHRKRGQILVMLTILIPVLLGVVAMGVDITVFYWTWSRMQSAA
ncbi:MAG TPA: TadE/TadG family type IV pilus assembly protein, partial [Sporolactobacillaceae bacterium]|nr:TadE/TadG family type IV pilus assembly protein [Sporolactobacillaceae bacterium]